MPTEDKFKEVAEQFKTINGAKKEPGKIDLEEIKKVLSSYNRVLDFNQQKNSYGFSFTDHNRGEGFREIELTVPSVAKALLAKEEDIALSITNSIRASKIFDAIVGYDDGKPELLENLISDNMYFDNEVLSKIQTVRVLADEGDYSPAVEDLINDTEQDIDVFFDDSMRELVRNRTDLHAVNLFINGQKNDAVDFAIERSISVPALSHLSDADKISYMDMILSKRDVLEPTIKKRTTGDDNATTNISPKV